MRNRAAASAASVVPLAIGLASMALLPTGSGQKVVTGAKQSAPAAVVFKSDLKAGCTLPFADIESENLAIDQTCSIDGNSGDDQGKRLESEQKNNFCVTGKPIPIDFDDFTQLGTVADKDEGLRNKLKSSRSDLIDITKAKNGASIGEGTLVRFVAFILDAHNSNVGKGELVNCNRPEKEANDIHIELTKDPKDDDACDSFTAEMSPHFRPQAWSELPSQKIGNPVRITGPLFFDGSHHPCAGGKRPSPQRISVWEIHPIYQIEVCKQKDIKQCSVDQNSQWVPLDQFLSDSENDDQ